MSRTAVALVFALLACRLPVAAQDAADLVKQGVALHDQGNYDAAIAKYREALKANPEDAEAYYELAFSLSAKKDCKGAIEASGAGLKIESQYRGPLYMIMGSCQDMLGDPNAALATYEKGVVEQPGMFLLHYNVGVTYAGMRRWTEARRALQRSVVLRPDHASSHQGLAKVYEEERYWVPAILAHLRFLSLEPATARSKASLAALDRLFKVGFKVTGKKNVTLTWDPDAKKDEGDFGAVMLAVTMGQATTHLNENDTKKTEPELSIERMEKEIALIAEPAVAAGGFAAEYYVPFLAALHKNALDEVFAYSAYQSAGPDVRKWLGKHEKDVTKLKEFLSGYRWPEVAVPDEKAETRSAKDGAKASEP